MIFYQGRCYVPLNPDLWRDIVRRYHNLGHDGILCTSAQVQAHYWWLGMTMFIATYVKGCPICQQNKVNTHPSLYPLLPIKSEATCPFQQILMDFITDLPKTVHSYDSILVVVDHNITKGVVFMPCFKTITTEQTATLYQDNIFRHFGAPSLTCRGRDLRFISEVFQKFADMMQSISRSTLRYQPQANGRQKRRVKTMV